jgi:IS605 OrfB family transposase
LTYNLLTQWLKSQALVDFSPAAQISGESYYVNKMIRAIRLELVKPISETWDTAGPTLRALARVTPKLLNAAFEARVAVGVVGVSPVKAAVAPQAKAESADGIAYQAVLRAVENLKTWGKTKNFAPFATLEVPGAMASAIARAATQAYSARDKKNPRFKTERILVRAAETSLAVESSETILSLQLRPKGGCVRFIIARSWGSHHDTIASIISGKTRHGDCKLQWDDRRRKWYALVAYEMEAASPKDADVAQTMAVHRGIRNAVCLMSTTGANWLTLSGAKYQHQRKMLQARMRNTKRISPHELGGGARGHGRARRYEHYDALEGKLSRATTTFTQQVAAFVATSAKNSGCGTVVIEDYGGMPVNTDAAQRRILDRFPFYELKQAIKNRCEKDGLVLTETSSDYISTTCPRCKTADLSFHNSRTGTFHCRACNFERAADWIAAFWMLRHSGANMTILDHRLKIESDLAASIHAAKENAHEQEVTESSSRDVRNTNTNTNTNTNRTHVPAAHRQGKRTTRHLRTR